MKATEKETFLTYVARFVEDAKEGRRLNAKNARFAAGTLKNYMKYRNVLIDYQTLVRRPLDYDAFTPRLL